MIDPSCDVACSAVVCSVGDLHMDLAIQNRILVSDRCSLPGSSDLVWEIHFVSIDLAWEIHFVSIELVWEIRFASVELAWEIRFASIEVV